MGIPWCAIERLPGSLCAGQFRATQDGTTQVPIGVARPGCTGEGPRWVLGDWRSWLMDARGLPADPYGFELDVLPLESRY